MPLGANKAAIMGVAGVSAGADVVLLYDTDHTNASSVSITSGITSTYGEYIFRFYNINAATDEANFQFQMGDSYNTAVTSCYISWFHSEADSYSGNIQTFGNQDQAQGTAFQIIIDRLGNGSDECGVAELHIFNPSSTTYAKQFYTTHSNLLNDDSNYAGFVSGYFNTTTALTQIQFKMDSGNFDGTIKMWGVK